MSFKKKSAWFAIIGVAVIVSVLALGRSGASADRSDPLVGFQYALEVEGKISAYFTDVSGIGSESDVVEHKVMSGSGQVIKKIPGRLTWFNVVLRRGITSNTDLWDWRQQVVDGKADSARSNFSIVALDQTGAETARWNFEDGWPCKIQVTMSGDGSAPIEELTITHEGMKRSM